MSPLHPWSQPCTLHVPGQEVALLGTPEGTVPASVLPWVLKLDSHPCTKMGQTHPNSLSPLPEKLQVLNPSSQAWLGLSWGTPLAGGSLTPSTHTWKSHPRAGTAAVRVCEPTDLQQAALQAVPSPCHPRNTENNPALKTSSWVQAQHCEHRTTEWIGLDQLFQPLF